MSDKERFEAGLAIVEAAGQLALNYFRKRDALTVQNKGPQDVVSEADVEVEKLIRNSIEKLFPQDAFLGEETGRTDFAKDQGIWVVDPIDGTQPFVNGLPHWCVSIAYVKAGKPRFGMVHAPARGEIFAGGVEFPATLNGKPINGTKAKSVREGLTGAGYSLRSGVDNFLPIFERLLRAGGMFYRDGSGAMDICDVAAGRLVGFFEHHINSWDCLAGLAICQAAGLKSNDFLANEGLWKGNWIIVAKEPIYAELEVITGYANVKT